MIVRCIALSGAVALSPAAGEEPIFVDRAAEAGVSFRHVNGMSGELYSAETMGPGGALFDYDGDGDLDLYLVQGQVLGSAPDPALTDRLYRNDLTGGSLKFTDVTRQSGLDAAAYGMGVATGDYDNDGWIDLYVTAYGENQLWRNQGDGTFADVTAEAGVGDSRWSIAAAFFDYDLDGRLDLYVGNYVNFTLTGNKFCPSPTGERDYCGPLAYQPLPDRLLRNRGPGEDGRVTFEDVTARVGLGAPSNGMGVVTGDWDGNGWPDLFVANDAMANQLWLNQGRTEDGVTFLDDALLAGCAFNLDGEPEASMGIAAGDVDADGDEDLFVTHLIHETNTFYVNRRGAFLDATRLSGLGTPGWLLTGFGVAFADYDNDGWLDVLVANGAVRLFDRDILLEAERGGESVSASRSLDQPNQLFKNLGPASSGSGRVEFVEVTEKAGEVFRLSETSRGVSRGDLDNDGDVDFVIHNNQGPVRILVNEVGHKSSWIGLRLVGSGEKTPPRDLLGARAEIVHGPLGGGPGPGGRTLVGQVRTDGSYASASDPRLLFGLGGDRSPVSVRVTWPDGEVEEYAGLAPGRYSIVRQGEGKATGK